MASVTTSFVPPGLEALRLGASCIIQSQDLPVGPEPQQPSVIPQLTTPEAPAPSQKVAVLSTAQYIGAPRRAGFGPKVLASGRGGTSGIRRLTPSPVPSP
jgi:hypothetical protein